MKKVSDLNLFIKQYKTRKQLQQLPSYLLPDIGITKEMCSRELRKNKIIPLLFSIFYLLVKGD